MNKKDEFKQGLESELEWVQYRLKILDIIDGKLLQMKKLAEQAKEKSVSPKEIEVLNTMLNNLAAQVNALDSESRKFEHEGMCD
jgi:hypothetical protein